MIDAEFFDRLRADSEDIAEECMHRQYVELAANANFLAHQTDAPPPESAVYVIGPRDGSVCKIGVANNPIKRLGALQVGNWEDLAIHGLFWVIEGSATGIEGLSLRVARKMGQKVRGEWVNLDPPAAGYIIGSVIHSANVKVASSAMWLRQRERLREAGSLHRHASGEEASCKPHLRSSNPVSALVLSRPDQIPEVARFR